MPQLNAVSEINRTESDFDRTASDLVAQARSVLHSSVYEVKALLGRGRHADVFMVKHRILGKGFALKMLHPHNQGAESLLRFKREARALGRLTSPHVVQIVDFAQTPDGHSYLVTELLRGETLGQFLKRRGTLSITETLAITRQALCGLSDAHEGGLLHRDLSPENVFLCEVADHPLWVKLFDFGLGHLSEPISTTDHLLTKTGTVMGSPLYCSPEALRGERLDERADVFGMGLIFFECITGKTPLELDLQALPRLANRQLDDMLRRATHADKNQRFDNAHSFLTELRSIDRAAVD